MVTFLISDIESSTRRWAEDPAMDQALELHDERTRLAIEEASGHAVKHTGDGVLAVFGDPADAVRAAARIQRSLDQAGWPGEPLRVRIGIHTGHAVERNGDYYGLAVSSAARIADAGHGGQVLVSTATASLLAPLPDGFRLIDLGTHQLKDLELAQHLHQLAGGGLAEAFPPLRTLEGVDHNLPLQLTSFIGREAQLLEVRKLVEQHRLVTITGVGGAGKTRLSLQVAAEMASVFVNGARFVELAPVSDFEAVPAAFASALGIRFEEGAPVDVTERIVERIRHLQMLLVVDNCEHVLDQAAKVIGEVLAKAERVVVLASSREGLGLAGEWIWQIPSLEVTADGYEPEAVLLFMERANAVAPDLELNHETRPHIERICRLLDGVPLAIELAASRARVLDLEQIADRLGDRFRLLTGGSRAALPRQQTLEAAVDWSYQLLGQEERLLFERLSVFRGGFSLEAVEGICAGGPIDALDVLDLLSALVEKSMVQAHTGAGTSRFGLLETLRQFAMRKLIDRGELGEWKDRHAAWFAEWASRLDHFGDDRDDDLTRTGAEEDNLVVALDWSNGQDEIAVPLAQALASYRFYGLGDPTAVLAAAETALTHRAMTPTVRAHLLCLRGRAEAEIGRPAEATATLHEAADAVDESFDAVAAVRLLAMISNGFGLMLDPAVGVEMAGRGIRRSEGGPSSVRALAHYAMGWAQVWAGAGPEAVLAPAMAAIEAAREAGVPSLELRVSEVYLLATMARDSEDGGDRTRQVEDRLLEMVEAGDSLAWGFEWLGIRRADWALVEGALEGMEGGGEYQRMGVLVTTGVMHWMRGRNDQAVDAFEKVVALGPPGRWHHDLFPSWAEATCLLGDLEGTRRMVDQHLAFRLRADEESMTLGTMRALVQAEVDAGHAPEAAAAVEQIRATLEAHPLNMGASVQLGTPQGYLACAEAELTRLTQPDPDAWARARRMTIWEYWRAYCDARRIEALRALGEPADREHEIVRAKAAELDFAWIVGLLDSLGG